MPTSSYSDHNFIELITIFQDHFVSYRFYVGDLFTEMEVTSVEGIQAALENEILKERLSALGLSSEEIRARLDTLSTEERLAVMADVEQLQAGGDGFGTLVSLAVLVLLVILIIKLMDKEITIK